MTTSPKSNPDNTVMLRGTLADTPISRDMPSGDVLVIFRLTVPRLPGERVKVDSLECVTSRKRIRKTLQRAQPGDQLEIDGSLHRRFWRSPSGPASRYAVDVTALRVVKPGRGAAASRDRTRASV